MIHTACNLLKRANSKMQEYCGCPGGYIFMGNVPGGTRGLAV
jgi:hypothetical protein